MKTIVLVHGAWLDASSWDKVIPALKAAGHEVINVNLPGMGKTLFLDNEGAINAIRESQHRMQAMSLIRPKLYQSENIASVDMQLYVHELIFYLVEGTDVGKRIKVEQNVERIELDVTQAVLVGLILNEAITNVIKYAFPGDTTGSVIVSMKRILNDHINLSISDNGIELPGNLDTFKMKSLGMNLMKGLANQLGSTFAFKNCDGLKIEVEFKYVSSIKII
jgi:two-component sensor histidine kinase